jgi:hypothetical protein
MEHSILLESNHRFQSIEMEGALYAWPLTNLQLLDVLKSPGHLE